MPLTTEQIDLISFIDQKVKNIISDGGNEISLMIGLLDEMSAIKALMESSGKKELDSYIFKM